LKNHLVFIIFDSCRFDAFQNAGTPNLDRLGKLSRRYAYTSWTSPSHLVYLMGLIPHESPRGVFASEVYKKEFTRWSQRLNIPDISFKGFVPELSLPFFLKSHGYRTRAMVSMPVLNETTVLNRHFDEYELMDAHNDFGAMTEKMRFGRNETVFYFLNVGETHYPYTLAGEKAPDLPRIHGVHGVFKHLDGGRGSAEAEKSPGVKTDFFDKPTMDALKEKQRKNVEFLDGKIGELYRRLPRNTHLIVTADHGELFGEDGYFGHGPVFHEKVFEIPYLEGALPV